MSEVNTLSNLSRRALRLLLEKNVASGWELASVVGGPDKLPKAMEPLLSQGFVDSSCNSEDDEERMLKSFFNVKPSAVPSARLALDKPAA